MIRRTRMSRLIGAGPVAALLLGGVLWFTAAAPGSAGATTTDARFEAALKRVDPSERLEQICDYAAVKSINRDKNPYKPDRAVIDSVSPVKIDGDTVRGKGGAFRSKGQWYQFSFVCKTSPDRLKILSFDYHIGEKIPEDKWDEYRLWR